MLETTIPNILEIVRLLGQLSFTMLGYGTTAYICISRIVVFGVAQRQSILYDVFYMMYFI